ncbi:MAG: hypothetical protein ABFR36_03570 [Acidobacteriota bacterium]
MYDKNQIIEEIKRVARHLKTASLKKKDFIKNTMIPVSTINFYISSWPDALLEAGLEEGKVFEEVNDRDLLKDLLRIEDEFGETPTYALIEKSGKYSKEDYENKWRNLDDAFKLASSKYRKKSASSPDQTILMNEGAVDLQPPDKTITATDKKVEDIVKELDMEKTLVSVKKEDIKLNEPGTGEFSDNFGSDNVLTLDEIRKKEKDKKKEEPEEPSFDYVSEDDGGIENLMAIDVRKKKKKKIIPKTVKPIGNKKDQGKAEKLNFRGIKYAPVDTRGVIYIFGLVSEELSYIVESFGKDKFCFSGKRNLSLEKEKWEPVNFSFTLNSSDLESSGRLSKNCELLVCWKHDWKECPVEVLELSSVLPGLEN